MYSDRYLDYYADRHFSYVYDSPEERAARHQPSAPPATSSDDGYDALRDHNMEVYGNRKALTEQDLRWGSWDR